MLGTIQHQDVVASTLFGKAQQAVLGPLFGRPDESFYLREIVRVARVGQGAVQRELRRLAGAGIIERTPRGRHVFCQANPRSPIFAKLIGLMAKTAGVCDVLRSTLVPLQDRIVAAFVFGSFASGGPRRASDVDVLVVGDATFAEVVAALGPAQEKLSREVNPAVYPPAEFREKLAAGHHFVTSVVNGPKVFLTSLPKRYF